MNKGANLLTIQPVSAEKVLALGDEVYYHKDGSITVDYGIKRCTTEGPGHRQCRAVFRISPCGCVRRTTWHYLVDDDGEIVAAKYDSGEGRFGNLNYECKGHRRVGFHKNS